MRVPDAPPFLFITGHSNIDQAVRLMRDGAADYVTKPFEMDAFLARLNELMRPQIDRSAPALGVAPCMREIEKLLFRVARISSTVLITGETGTGKEVAARFLHECQRQRAGLSWPSIAQLFLASFWRVSYLVMKKELLAARFGGI